MRSVGVVIPTFNEAGNILALIDEILANLPQDSLGQVLVVDDNSPDGTAQLVEEKSRQNSNVNLLIRKGKMGLGSAYIDGFRQLYLTVSPDFYIQMDADFSHPPKMLSALITTSSKYRCVSVGSRYISGGGLSGWPITRIIVSNVANLIAKLTLRLPISDFTSGYRCLPRRAVQLLLSKKMASSGYDYQIESLKTYWKGGICIKEVPFIYKARATGKTKLSIRDMVTFIFTLVRLVAARNR